ncbi:peptidoglycan-binding protein [Streptomyces sp. 6N223]|uniref:peptidoglycan-binding protein n=1 Tax=Streptomyces sp. 6N223 TaxID=3457412 RepID=UPI003FD4101A
MIWGTDCLVCGRPALPSGEPSCDCLTHSLSRPVGPPEHGPDPADVARFPLEPTEPSRPEPPPIRRGPRHRAVRHRRIAATAGGAVAAVVGCTALAAAFLGGLPEGDEGSSRALPDGGRLPTPGPTESTGPTESGESGESDATPDATPDGPPRDTPSESPGGAGDADPAPGGGRSPSPGETEGSGSVASPEPSPAATDGGGSLASGSPTDPGPDPDPTPGQAAPTATDNPVPLVLREGDRGPEVVELQKRLLQLNWLYEGRAHGRYDAATREAVATFQVSYGVQGDEEGVYGVNTRARLEESTAEPRG